MAQVIRNAGHMVPHDRPLVAQVPPGRASHVVV